MEWDLPEVEVQAEGEVEWGERALEPDPAGIVSAPVAALDFLIKSVLPAIT